MDYGISDLRAAPRHETLMVAVLLAIAGGYLDAYTWIVHRVLANAQTANLVFLWVHATAGRWNDALHYAPPLAAFAAGVLVAAILRRFAGDSAAPLSVLIEIMLLVIVAILHNRLPGVAGTLGISFVAAVQTASFRKVESWAYSSVLATSNFRQAVESVFAAFAGTGGPNAFRCIYVFSLLCIAFGMGAATGAYTTERLPALTLGVPATVLLVALLLCESEPRKRGPG
jgi:uncharacterized membrane protein YoaK (UPF0700 family)